MTTTDDLPDPGRNAIGKALRALREQKKMSIDAMATAAMRETSTIEAVEAGTDELRFDLLVSMADALGVTLGAVVRRATDEDV